MVSHVNRRRARGDGVVEAELRAEFRGLRLDWTAVGARVARSPATFRAASDSSRIATAGPTWWRCGRGRSRTPTVPSFTRSAWIPIPPASRASRRRSTGCCTAGFARGALNDAMLIALVETGVPVWALDADLVDPGGLGIRTRWRRPARGRAQVLCRPPAGSSSPTRASPRSCSVSSCRDTRSRREPHRSRAVRRGRRRGPGDPHRGGALGVLGDVVCRVVAPPRSDLRVVKRW